MDTQELLHKAKTFLADTSQAYLVDQLQAFSKSDEFKVCIVGGFSRGKSHFINLLLGASILPESAVPTTGVLTEIRYGAEPKLEIVFPDKVEERSLSANVLDEFSLYNNARRDVCLRLFSPLPLLKNGLVLVDTPGIEDALESTEEISSRALEGADAAIVMVSAVAPFSLSECAFINEYLVDRQVPLIAAALSYGDRIPEESRKKQLEFIIKRCHDFYPDMQVLAPDCYGAASRGLVCGIDALRTFLAAWQNLPELGRLRQRAVLYRLREVVEGELASLKARRALLTGDIQKARLQIAEALASLEDGSEAAMDLRLQFLDAAEGIKDQTRKELRSFCDTLLSAAGGTVSEESVMDAALGLHARLTAETRDKLERAVTKLNRQLEEKYGVPANLAGVPEIGFAPLAVTKIRLPESPDNTWLDDLLQKGLDMADVFAQKFPGGPVVWPILKPRIRDLAKKAQDYLLGDSRAKAAYKREVTGICANLGRLITEGVQQLYETVYAQIKAARLQWLKARRDELARDGSLEQTENDLAHIDAKLATGNVIAEKISARLGELK